jgi:hypothetical protein
MSEPSPRGKKERDPSRGERSSTRDRKDRDRESSRKDEKKERQSSTRKKEDLTSSSESSVTDGDDKRRLRSASSRNTDKAKGDSSRTHSPRTKSSDKEEKKAKEASTSSTSTSTKDAAPTKETAVVVAAAAKKGLDDSMIKVPSEAVVRPIQLADGEDLDGEAALFGQQKEALLMLLEARMLLTKMVRWRWIKEQNEIEERRKKTQEEKKKRGKLSVTEIQSVLKSQPDGEDGDWTSGSPSPSSHCGDRRSPPSIHGPISPATLSHIRACF